MPTQPAIRHLVRLGTKPFRCLFPAIAALIVSACGGSREPVVVAAVGEWSGPDEIALKQGIELAVQQVNDAGGVNGRPLRVDFHDDKHDVTEAARVAAELVADPEVVAVLGHTRSDPTLVAMKVYDGQMPVINPRLSSPDLTGLSTWLFQAVPTDSAYSAAVVRFAAERGLRRTALLFNNTARGRATAEHFQKQYRGSVVAMDPAYFPAPLPGDLKTFVDYHRQQAPDLVFAPIGEPKEYIQQAQAQGLRAVVVGWDVWSSQTRDPSLPGDFYHVVPVDLASQRDETRAFLRAFRNAAHAEPTPFAAIGYDATRLIARAAAEGGDRAGIRRWLAALRPESAQAGVIGSLSFAPDGTAVGPEPVIVPVRTAAASAGGRP